MDNFFFLGNFMVQPLEAYEGLALRGGESPLGYIQLTTLSTSVPIHLSWYDLPSCLSRLFPPLPVPPPHLCHLPTPSDLICLPSTTSAPTLRCTHATMLHPHLD